MENDIYDNMILAKKNISEICVKCRNINCLNKIFTEFNEKIKFLCENCTINNALLYVHIYSFKIKNEKNCSVCKYRRIKSAINCLKTQNENKCPQRI